MATDRTTRQQLLSENEELRLRLEEAEETLRAIQSGEVDALVISSPGGNRIYTLEGAEETYRILVESMSEGAATLAPDATILYCNSLLATMLKVPLEKLIGSPLKAHVAPADADAFTALIGESSKGTSRGELSLVTGKGDFVPILLSCSAMDHHGISAVLTDLSEQKRSERILQAEIEEKIRTMEELRQKEQMLLQQNRQAAMGEMIGNIAHQWRQPLNVLGLMVQELRLLYRAGKLSDKRLDAYVEKSMQTIRHMSQTIDDFRNFFRTDKEQVQFNVLQMIRKSLSLMEGAFREQAITVQVRQQSDPVLVGYPSEFSQAILNILGNAKDAFLQKKIEKPMIKIGLFTEDGRVVVTVTDNAGGIPAEIIDRIFNPYFTTKEPDQGTGVGLFMSQTIIEKNMNGRLSVRNTDDGAEFRIEVSGECVSS